MELNIKELINGIKNSDILGLGKDNDENIYITQAHFILKIDKDTLINNIRLATTIENDFEVDDVNKIISNIDKNTLVFHDGRKSVLSDVLDRATDSWKELEKIAVIEHNTDDEMTLLEHKVSREQVVMDSNYFNMIKGYGDIYVSGEFNPIVIVNGDDILGYVLPKRVANKKLFFKYGRNK